MTWVREGYCCRCGDCCKGDPGTLMPRAASVAGYCPLYEMRSGEGYCVGHTGAVPKGHEDPYYLSACQHWPDDPRQIKDKPRCTYTFRWVDDGKDLLDH